MAKKKKAKPEAPKPRVHQELRGFEVSIDSFGELTSNMPIEKINAFLNENVDDKKLAERNDYEALKTGKRKKSK